MGGESIIHLPDYQINKWLKGENQLSTYQINKLTNVIISKWGVYLGQNFLEFKGANLFQKIGSGTPKKYK